MPFPRPRFTRIGGVAVAGQHVTDVATTDVTHEAVSAASCTVRVGFDGADIKVGSGGVAPIQKGRMGSSRVPHIGFIVAEGWVGAGILTKSPDSNLRT